jgi:hypothetical protein
MTKPETDQRKHEGTPSLFISNKSERTPLRRPTTTTLDDNHSTTTTRRQPLDDNHSATTTRRQPLDDNHPTARRQPPDSNRPTAAAQTTTHSHHQPANSRQLGRTPSSLPSIDRIHPTHPSITLLANTHHQTSTSHQPHPTPHHTTPHHTTPHRTTPTPTTHHPHLTAPTPP